MQNMHIRFFRFCLEVPFLVKGASTKKVTSKCEIQCKKGMYFSFDFGWYDFYLDIVCKSRGWVFFGLTEKSIKHDKIYLSIVPNFGPKNEIDSLSLNFVPSLI